MSPCRDHSIDMSVVESHRDDSDEQPQPEEDFEEDLAPLGQLPRVAPPPRAGCDTNLKSSLLGGCFLFLFLAIVVFYVKPRPAGMWFPVEPRPLPDTMHIYQLRNEPQNVSLTVYVHERWVVLIGDSWAAASYPNGRQRWIDHEGYSVALHLSNADYNIWTTPFRTRILKSPRDAELDPATVPVYALVSWQQSVPVVADFDLIKVPVSNKTFEQRKQGTFPSLTSIRSLFREIGEVREVGQAPQEDIHVMPLFDKVDMRILDEIASRHLVFDPVTHLLAYSEEPSPTPTNLTDVVRTLSRDCRTWHPMNQLARACNKFDQCVNYSKFWFPYECSRCECTCLKQLRLLLFRGNLMCGDCLDAEHDRNECVCWVTSLLYLASTALISCCEEQRYCEHHIPTPVFFPCNTVQACNGQSCDKFLFFCSSNDVYRDKCVVCREDNLR